MHTISQIFDAATYAENVGRCLHWSQILKLHNADKKAAEQVDNAVDHLKHLAWELGYAMTPRPPDPKPAPRTAEAFYTEGAPHADL